MGLITSVIAFLSDTVNNAGNNNGNKISAYHCFCEFLLRFTLSHVGSVPSLPKATLDLLDVFVKPPTLLLLDHK